MVPAKETLYPPLSLSFPPTPLHSITSKTLGPSMYVQSVGPKVFILRIKREKSDTSVQKRSDGLWFVLSMLRLTLTLPIMSMRKEDTRCMRSEKFRNRHNERRNIGHACLILIGSLLLSFFPLPFVLLLFLKKIGYFPFGE